MHQILLDPGDSRILSALRKWKSASPYCCCCKRFKTRVFNLRAEGSDSMKMVMDKVNSPQRKPWQFVGVSLTQTRMPCLFGESRSRSGPG
jgi:hypothetical protein